ncbi:hypothetical protein [Tuwongella immobilis]|uniref:HEAT repeat domain-containing protein n=1 Tax=Tuwongella immobilis TaxID=692036 RepID=A0A6C2YK57_9BACT|nr:hypothetical protein [Tuwongella immobilis]VIP01681.1 hypothetical protein : : HEAT [Tuwongella immobilis]VTR99131.1 hypothetical protein : : HEAT [Tuwongella immobilis]
MRSIPTRSIPMRLSRPWMRSIRRMLWLGISAPLVVGCDSNDLLSDTATRIHTEATAPETPPPNHPWATALADPNIHRRRLISGMLAALPAEQPLAPWIAPSELLERLNDPDLAVREAIVQTIFRHADAFPRAATIAALRPVLAMSPPHARIQVIGTLLRIDPRTGPGVAPLLQELLLADDATIADACLNLLARIGPGAVPVLHHGLRLGSDRLRARILPELLRRPETDASTDAQTRAELAQLEPNVNADLRSQFTLVRMLLTRDAAAAATLQSLLLQGDAYPRLLGLQLLQSALGHRDTPAREPSAAQSRILPLAAIVRHLTQDSEPLIAAHAWRLLHALAAPAPESLVQAAFQSPHRLVRLAAAEYRADQPEPPHNTILAAIQPLLREPSDQWESAIALSRRLAPESAADCQAHLRRTLEFGRDDWRLRALQTWIAQFPQSPAAIRDALARELTPSAPHRFALLHDLATAPETASAVRPELLALLQQPDPATQQLALAALTGPLPDSTWSLLQSLAQSEHVDVRLAAISAATRIDAQRAAEQFLQPLPASDIRIHGESIDVWKQRLADADPERRFLTLQRLTPLSSEQAAAILPAIWQRLTDSQRDIRIAAVQTLVSLAHHDPEIPPRLRRESPQLDAATQAVITDSLLRFPEVALKSDADRR